MAGYTINPYYPTVTGTNTSGYFSGQPYQSTLPMQQQSGNILTIFIGSEEEANSYPVAAGTTVLLLCFPQKKFWLKSTSTSGVPEQLREFTFDEKTPTLTARGSVSRDEFDKLSEKIDKLINDLGGASNG